MPFFNQTSQITTTWAAKPSGYVGLARITDVGVNGSNWYSDGTNWNHDGMLNILSSGNNFIVSSMLAANAATYSQSGTTITVSHTAHGLTAAQHNGAQIYFVIGSGLATTGWYTNFTYINANSYSVTSAVSQTTSGVINTNANETTITPLSTTIKSNLLGLNGSIFIDGRLNWLSSANSKIFRMYFGGTNYYSKGQRTDTQTDLQRIMQNRGSLSAQVTSGATADLPSFASGTLNTLSINTSNDQAHIFSIQISSANEWASIPSFTLRVLPA